MVNKEEKRILKTYLLPNLKEIQRIAFDYKDIYGTSKLIKPGTEGKEGLWRAFSDIWGEAFSTYNWLEQIANEHYMKRQSIEKKLGRIDKEAKQKREREQKLIEMQERAFEEGKKYGICTLDEIKEQIELKGYKEGMKDAKQVCKMSDNEILLAAENIKRRREKK